MRKNIKRFIHKFFIDDRGAVSIYLIIITLFIFLFNAVLIDFARILVAERQTEEAAKTALRSTMSSYNKALQDKGLFGFDGDQEKANQIFQDVFKENLGTGEGETFNYLGLKPIEGEITTNLNFERSLGNKDILEYQILEEMKYKAPVEIAEAIIEGFLSISDEMEEASVYAKVAKTLDEKAEERDAILEDAKIKLTTAQTDLDGIRDKVMGELSDNDNYPSVTNINDIFKYHRRYLDDYEDEDYDYSGYTGTGMTLKKREAITFKGNSVRLLTELINTVKSAKEDTEDAKDLIQDAMDIETEMEEVYSSEQEETSQHYSDAKNLNKSDDGFEDEGGLGNATESLEDYFLGEEYYEELTEAVDTVIQIIDKENSRTDSLLPKLEEFKQIVSNDFPGSKINNKVRNLVINSQKFYGEDKDVTQHLSDALEIIKNGQKEYEKKEDEIEDKETEADDELEKTNKTLDDIEKDFKNVSGDTELYTGTLREYVLKYKGTIEQFGNEFSMEDKDEASEESMSFIDLLFSSIGEKLLSARDELYINEYILMRFNSHDFGKSGTEAYLFEDNQVEYIVYGNEAFGVNHFSALSEIFAVRFAINFVASLLDMKKKLLGPLMWVTTLAEALVRTADDMKKLTKGDELPLFPNKRKPTASYQDYLRLFLFVHPEGMKTERVMAVLHHDTKTDLSESPTYVTGNATSSINLWFLPQVIKMIGSTEVINGRVEDNVYYIEKEVHYSY